MRISQMVSVSNSLFGLGFITQNGARPPVQPPVITPHDDFKESRFTCQHLNNNFFIAHSFTLGGRSRKSRLLHLEPHVERVFPRQNGYCNREKYPGRRKSALFQPKAPCTPTPLEPKGNP